MQVYLKNLAQIVRPIFVWEWRSAAQFPDTNQGKNSAHLLTIKSQLKIWKARKIKFDDQAQTSYIHIIIVI